MTMMRKPKDLQATQQLLLIHKPNIQMNQHSSLMNSQIGEITNQQVNQVMENKRS